VPDEPHAALSRIRSDRLQVEVGRGIEEAKILVAAPADVPALEKNAIEAVLGGEINVTPGVRRCRTMIRSGAPGAVPQVDFPPDANVLPGLHPADIAEPVRLVEVQYEVRVDEPGRITGNLYRPPWRHQWRCHTHSDTVGPGSECRLKNAGSGSRQRKRRVVDERCFMDADMNTRLQQQRQRRMGVVDVRDRRRPVQDLVLILMAAWLPVRRDPGIQAELGQLVRNFHGLATPRQLVTEPDPIVEDAHLQCEGPSIT